MHLGSMPASVRAAIDRFGDSHRTGPADHPQRPVRRRDAPQRHHARGAGPRRRCARRLGRQPGAPRRRRRRRARFDPGRRDRDPPRRTAAPAGAAHRRGARGAVRQLADAGRALGRSRRAGRRERGRCRAARVDHRHRARRATRCSSTPSAACAPRCRDMPDGSWTATDVLDSTGPGQPPATHHRARDDRRRRHHVRLHRHGRTTAGQRQRGRGGHDVGGVVRAAVGHGSDDSRERRRAASAACRRAARARSSPREPPVAVGAGNVEVSQRIADVCLARARVGGARSSRRRRRRGR